MCPVAALTTSYRRHEYSDDKSTRWGKMDERQAVAAVAKAVQSIPAENFSAWPGGWPDQIGISLVDAVYSIRAVYQTKDPAKGVLGRAKLFRDAYPHATNDLARLRDLGEKTIRQFMGNSKSIGRYKSACIIEAAGNFLSLEQPVRVATDLRALDPAHRRAYTKVTGLGEVTYEYFTMLLGQPGIKADRMIRGFVDAALKEQRLAPVSAAAARRIVEAVQAAERPDVELHKVDHAIWIYQRGLPKNTKYLSPIPGPMRGQLKPRRVGPGRAPCSIDNRGLRCPTSASGPANRCLACAPR